MPVVAEPVVDNDAGTWTVRVREIGRGPGKLRDVPSPTYSGGNGISLFTGIKIPGAYIKAMAQAGKMASALYAIALKRKKGRLEFRPPEQIDLDALADAEKELARLRPGWERDNVIPTEKIPVGDKTGEPMARGIRAWADMFSARQLLCMGVLVEELRRLRSQIVEAEGEELGEAVMHLLALILDKFLNWNAVLSSWNVRAATCRSVFDRHDFSWKATVSEMAPCNAGSGLEWAAENAVEAYEELASLPRIRRTEAAVISLGSATRLPQCLNGNITAVVVDPPYADNVQYSELADFFYVWLKRTQGHRRPEWFSTYLCEHDQEAVVNVSRYRDGGAKSAKQAREEAHAFYQGLMADTFRECRRILRDDGVLTVMFTHKKQEAWEALFASLLDAGFTITATWPVKTESEHSLHQARKNAAQSTVLLVARKRPEGAGVGYFDAQMAEEIAHKARSTAERLEGEGLNPVDQLVGSFGPAMEVFGRYDEVRTDVGDPVGVGKAIDIAADAVSRWRIEKLAARGLEGVEPEAQFALLCWDVLGAAEFRFNEAKLLGHAVGRDVSELEVAGLVRKSGDKIAMLSAKERRRSKPLEPDEIEELEFGLEAAKKRRRKKDALKVHPNDPQFRTAIDGCHALALRYIEAGGGAPGIGSARALARQQQWGRDSAVARLMEALTLAAPPAVRHERGAKSAAAKFPEFRAWHALLQPLFEMKPPDWEEKPVPQMELFAESEDVDGEDVEDLEVDEDEYGD